MIASELNLGDDPHRTNPQIGFAEIELFSNGQNVAFGASVDTNFPLKAHSNRSLSALTDGRNIFGRILPVRRWLGNLARRHDLETERPMVVAELGLRYARQNTNLNRMTWLAALLAVGIGFTALINRNIRFRREAHIRERLAADLHDELGGNLHAIGLLGDHAQSISDSPEKLNKLLQRLRALTERTSDAARYCTKTLTDKTLYEDLAEEMRRTAGRIMVDVEHQISFEGDEHLLRLKRDDRADLFLFYKESLVNISRHSDATEFSTRLVATAEDIRLTIRDNGRGFSNSEGDGIPLSLKRRAKLLGAKVKVETPEDGGTCINLQLRTRRWRFFPRTSGGSTWIG